MNAQWTGLITRLASWEGERVAVEVVWHTGLKRLARMSGPLGPCDVTEEPDRWGDVHVRVSIPIGDAGRLVLDEAEVEDMAMHAGDIGIDMEAVDVLISKWPPGVPNVGLPAG